MGKKGAAAVLLGVAIAALVSLVTVRAEAHAVGLSNGEYEAHGAALTAKLTFARGEIAELSPGLDADRDGHVTALEVHDARAELERDVLGGVHVKGPDGAACAPALTDAALTEQDGLAVAGRWVCPREGAFSVEVALMSRLARGHRHVARVAKDGVVTREEILYGDHRTFDVEAAPAGGEGAAPAGPSAEPAAAHASRPLASGATAFLRMGIEHILTGYDHLVFLLGLVLLRARVKQLLAVVTAFTVAHSITLALAVLGVLAPSPRIIEPAIALSIAYVGVENFFVKDGSKRWRITFPFGLIHGFGFAGALKEIDLPRASIPTALVSFNVGVEIGQLAVMAVILPLVFLLRDRQRWFDPQGVRVLSGAVAVAGGVWFVSRVAFG
jgi:hydrogenase/urease accessory protein HupE